MIGHENILPQHTFFTYDRFAADMAEMPDPGAFPDDCPGIDHRRRMNKIFFHIKGINRRGAKTQSYFYSLIS
jgi:hypothetical protein